MTGGNAILTATILSASHLSALRKHPAFSIAACHHALYGSMTGSGI
ncbi:MAG: hypothetical protein ACK50J_04550 [Planctomyces sp.]